MLKSISVDSSPGAWDWASSTDCKGRSPPKNPISQVLFKSALSLADNRKLLDIDDENLGAHRQAFALEIQEALRRINAIDALKAARRAGI